MGADFRLSSGRNHWWERFSGRRAFTRLNRQPHPDSLEHRDDRLARLAWRMTASVAFYMVLDNQLLQTRHLGAHKLAQRLGRAGGGLRSQAA